MGTMESEQPPGTSGAHCVAPAIALALWYCVGTAHAERVSIKAEADAQLAWTSNSTLGSAGGPDDTILEVSSRAVVHAEGARLSLNGVAGLRATGYAQHTQPSSIVPEIDLSGRVEAIERLFYVEAAYRATQTGRDAYGARPESATTSNSRTIGQTRLSPYLEGAVSPGLRYRLRSDNTWINEVTTASQTRDTAAAGYYGLQTAVIESDPKPFGWRVSADRSETRYEESSRTSLVQDTVRFGLRLAPSEEYRLGVSVGTERNNFTGNTERRTVSGVDLLWQPSPRTRIDALEERQFFGSSWRLAFGHRNPQLAVNVELKRRLDTTPQSLFELPGAGNVSSLLDAMFTTRYPDPVERARIVQEYISRQGLPATTSAPVTIFAQRLSIVTSRTASLAFNGVRSSVVFSTYDILTQDALDAGLLGDGNATSNNRQYGLSLALTHRLSPTTGFSAGVDWSRIRGVGAFDADATTQRGARAQVNLQLGAKTTAFAGGRYRQLQSTIVSDGREGAVFAGMNHGF